MLLIGGGALAVAASDALAAAGLLLAAVCSGTRGVFTPRASPHASCLVAVSFCFNRIAQLICQQQVHRTSFGMI